MQIQSASLENEPGGVGNAIKRLREAAQTIPEQASDPGWGNNAPACFFDHQHNGAVRRRDRSDQPFTEEFPLACLEVQVMGNESTERINQYGLPRSKVIDHFHKLSSGFDNTPMFGSTLAVSHKSLLPITVIRSGCCRSDISDHWVVIQEMLSPSALAATGWPADQDQAAFRA